MLAVDSQSPGILMSPSIVYFSLLCWGLKERKQPCKLDCYSNILHAFGNLMTLVPGQMQYMWSEVLK